jgi:hypothetical protein
MGDASLFGQTGRKLTWAWPSLFSIRLFKEAFSLQKQEHRHSSPKPACHCILQEVQQYYIHCCKKNFTCAEMVALGRDSLTTSAFCTALNPVSCGEQKWAPFSNSTKYRNQISRDDYRQQIDMEAAYSRETKTSQHHHQTITQATRQKIKSSD